MSIFNSTRRTRAVARALFPSAPEALAPELHGRDGTIAVSKPLGRGRLRYRATPFYLKIQGLEGPRPPRYVRGD